MEAEKEVWILKRCGQLAASDDVLELHQREVTIGRSEDATYCIVSTFISRQHAKFKKENGCWFVKDCNSLNGIYVNNVKLTAGQEYPLAEGDTIGFGQPTTKLWDKKAHVYKLCLRTVDQTKEKVESELMKCYTNVALGLPALNATCTRRSTITCESPTSSKPLIKCVPSCPYSKKESSDIKLLDFYSRLKCANPFGCFGVLSHASDTFEGQTSMVRQPLREALNVGSESYRHSSKSTQGSSINQSSDVPNSVGDIGQPITIGNDEENVPLHDSKCDVKLQLSAVQQPPASMQFTSNMVCQVVDGSMDQSSNYSNRESCVKELPKSNLMPYDTSVVKNEDVRRDKEGAATSIPCDIKFKSASEKNITVFEPKVSLKCANAIKHLPCPDLVSKQLNEVCEKDAMFCSKATSSKIMTKVEDDKAAPLPTAACETKAIKSVSMQDDSDDSLPSVLQPVRVRWLSSEQLCIDRVVNKNIVSEDFSILEGVNSIQSKTLAIPKEANNLKTETTNSKDEPIVISDSDDSSSFISPPLKKHSDLDAEKMLVSTKTVTIHLKKCVKCDAYHTCTVGCIIAGSAKMKLSAHRHRQTLRNSDSDDESFVVRKTKLVSHKTRNIFLMKHRVISSGSDTDEGASKRRTLSIPKRPISDSDSDDCSEVNVQNKRIKKLVPKREESTLKCTEPRHRSLFDIGNEKKLAVPKMDIPASAMITRSVTIGSPSVPKRLVASLAHLVQKKAEAGSLFLNVCKQPEPKPQPSSGIVKVGECLSNSQSVSLTNIDTVKVKREPLNPHVEKMSVDSDSDGECGYTQDDEVILISDDEVQYFASTQPTPVKSEPEWGEENSWSSWANAEIESKEVMQEQLQMLGISNVNTCMTDSDKQQTCDPVNVTEVSDTNASVRESQWFPVLSQNFYEDGTKDNTDDKFFPEHSQSVDNDGIKDRTEDKFFPELSQNFYDDGLKDRAEDDKFFPERSQSVDDGAKAHTEDDQFFPELSQNFYDDSKDHTEDDQFFPDLSQNFYNDAGSDHEFEDNAEAKQLNSHLDIGNVGDNMKSKATCKFYRTKLTEAIPMVPKNKRQGAYQNNSKVKEKDFFSAVPSRPVVSKQTKRGRKKDSLGQLKKKIQKDLGNRIPIPGGGSAIPRPPINLKNCDSTIKEIPKSTTSTKVLPPPRPFPSVANSSMANSSVKLSEYKLTMQAGKPNKSRAVAKMSNRAEMRSTFLTEICLQDKQRLQKNNCDQPPTTRKLPRTSSLSRETVQSDSRPAVTFEKCKMSHGDNIGTNDSDKLLDENVKDKVLPQRLQPALKPPAAATVKKVRFNDKEETRYFTGTFKNVEKCQVARVAPMYNEESNNPGPNLKPSFINTVDDVLRSIVSWVPAWLTQQEHNEKPPPVINYKKLWPTLLAYKSYDDYVQVYKPLLLLETWATITKDWKLNQPPYTIVVAITEMANSLPKHGVACTDFTCQTLCTPEEINMGRHPQEGQILILDIVIQPAPTKDNPNVINVKQVLPVFAYIEKSAKSPFRLATLPQLAHHPAARTENATVVTFWVKTKQRSVPINTNGFMKAQVVSYLRPTMRQFQALFHLPRTILARDILQPRIRTCSMMTTPYTHLQVKGTFNQQQRDVILAIADACSQGSVPKVCLLQGPPGTGKSHTVVGVVQQLLFGNDMKNKSGLHPKILLTAPSNSAIDELVVRLIKVKKAIAQTRSFRLVRVGSLQHVHPEVRQYMLENLVNQNLETRLKERNTTESVEQELRCLEAQSNALHTKLESVCLRNLTDRVPAIRKELADIQRKIERLQKQKNFCLPTPIDRRKEEQRLMVEMLQGADVVATTLSSCRQAHMEVAFLDPKTTFSACIVDEATQCIEQLILLPLMFGITKLILVGDPQQLPATVLSQKAMEFGLHQSLFERLYLHFKQRQEQSPVWMLTTQYRMHPKICQFPSKCFYENKLESHGLLETKYRRNQFSPYMLFDLKYVQEEGDIANGFMCNPREADFIITLISVILRLNQQQLTVGIITPYQRQKQLLKTMLKIRFPHEAHSIEVNTVDGFQGREKDLIILSTVRAKNESGSIGFLTHEKRLCVALTRAKQSFYICGHLSSLQVNSSWRALIHDARERGHVVEIPTGIPEEQLSNYILAPN